MHILASACTAATDQYVHHCLPYTGYDTIVMAAIGIVAFLGGGFGLWYSSRERA